MRRSRAKMICFRILKAPVRISKGLLRTLLLKGLIRHRHMRTVLRNTEVSRLMLTRSGNPHPLLTMVFIERLGKSDFIWIDVSGEQSSKMDIKKMVPRLRLDLLPNYHLKNQKTTANPMSNLNLNLGGTAGLSNVPSNSKHPYLQQLATEAFQNNIGSSYALGHSSISVGSGAYKSSGKK